MESFCEKCNRVKKGLEIETAERKHFFCKPCLKKAADTLAMMPFKNQEVRSLLKVMRKYLNHEEN
ncbi:hypothetical protein M0R04_14290 [Candidatus Dojkabacteria bacterium]|jgi:hypothetical protein|nr:hypothetical protein [Candidatus Dojkabacteria bacterium]